MRCFDRTKVYELVDKYILNLLECIMRKGRVGLYRDDSLGKDLKFNGKEIYKNLYLILQSKPISKQLVFLLFILAE